jgi:hypothetical protein
MRGTVHKNVNVSSFLSHDDTCRVADA